MEKLNFINKRFIFFYHQPRREGGEIIYRLKSYLSFWVMLLFCIIATHFINAYASDTMMNNHTGIFQLNGDISDIRYSKIYPSGTTTFVAGKFGSAANIPTNIVVPNADLTISATDTVVSVAFWYKWSGTGLTTSPGFQNYCCQVSGDKMYYGITTTGAQNDLYYTNNPFVVGQWTHIIIEFGYKNIATCAMYVNGIKQTLTKMNANFKSSTAVWGKDFYFNCGGYAATDYVDEVHIWNRALTDVEASRLYSSYFYSPPTMSNTVYADTHRIDLTWQMEDAAVSSFLYRISRKVDDGPYSSFYASFGELNFTDMTCYDLAPPIPPSGFSHSYSGSTVSTQKDAVTWAASNDSGTRYTYYVNALNDVNKLTYISSEYTSTITSGIKCYFINGISPNQFMTPTADIKFVNSDSFSSGTAYGVYAQDNAGNNSTVSTFYVNPPPFIIQSVSLSSVDFSSVSPLTSDYPIDAATSINIEANYYTDISAKGLGNFVGSNPSNTIPISALSLRFRDFTGLQTMGLSDVFLKNWTIEKPHFDANDGILDKYHVLNTQTGKYNYGLSNAAFILDAHFKSSWSYAPDNYSATVQITIAPGQMQ